MTPVTDSWMLLCAGGRTFLGNPQGDPSEDDLVLSPCFEILSVRVQRGAELVAMIQAHRCHHLVTPSVPVHFPESATAIVYVADLDELDKKMLTELVTTADTQRASHRTLLSGVITVPSHRS